MKVMLDGPMAWIMLVIILCLIAVGPFYLRHFWRGETRRADFITAGLWYSSDEFRRGHRRAALPIFTNGYAILGFGLTLYLIPPVPRGQVDYPASIALSIALGVMAVSTAFYWAIVLYNVPKSLVPPGRRAEPGALAERRQKTAAAATLTPGDPGSAE